MSHSSPQHLTDSCLTLTVSSQSFTRSEYLADPLAARAEARLLRWISVYHTDRLAVQKRHLSAEYYQGLKLRRKEDKSERKAGFAHAVYMPLETLDSGLVPDSRASGV